jgi:predicted amidohydrolase YtcJ
LARILRYNKITYLYIIIEVKKDDNIAMGTTANLILANANIITCEYGRPKAEALAVKGDRIMLVGNNQEAKNLKGKQTRIIDCRGRTLVPGFNDAHCHIFPFIRQLCGLDFSPLAVRSIEEIKQAIRRQANMVPEGSCISGTDYNEFYLTEKRHPTRLDLDEVAPRHPVVLSHRSLHACVLNSLALQMAGIDNESEEPPGGIIERDLGTGEPNGILYEMLDYVRARIPASISDNEMELGIAQANQRYLSLGITSIGEASVTNGLREWQTYLRLKGNGKIKSRIYMMLGGEHMAEFKAAGLVTGCGDDNLRVGSVKIVLSETTGRLKPSQEELNQIVLEASQSAFQVAIHAVERSTVEAAVTALEFARGKCPQVSSRPRLEHCSECPPALRRRLSRLKAVVVSQPAFLYYSGERYLAQVDAESQKWLYPFKSLIDSGVVVAGSSDSPVVPNNPLTGLYAAVSRQSESAQKVLAAEGVTPGQALEMYTSQAAYATFEEKIKGSLGSGKLADIVMLTADPLQVSAEELKQIRVEMAVVGGVIEYQA